MKVLVACEMSGTVRESFLALGHNAWSCDLLPTLIPGPHFQLDVFSAIDIHGPWDLMIAHPPCTDLCVSGARWFEEKKETGQQEEALNFVKRLVNVSITRIAIENPVGILSSRWRKPDQYIQPWQFGQDEQKKTGLWLKNLPLLVPTNDVGRDYKEKTHLMAKTPDRGLKRSITYKGIADAMAAQWGCLN